MALALLILLEVELLKKIQIKYSPLLRKWDFVENFQGKGVHFGGISHPENLNDLTMYKHFD